ncbi:MAG: asparagine--tRNA ligase [Mycoplasmoidaceae bacterium]|nr:MAG: asparagine--tRNA ligase [Mycoplasmoidaceae bacterium]
MKVIEIAEILKGKKIYKSEIGVHGWIKSTRDSGKISFIELNDGSSILNLQIVAKKETTKGYDQVIKNARTGSSIVVRGIIKTSARADGGKELEASSLEILKQADEDYPLQKKQHSLEFLRDIAHLRPRTKTIGAIMRVRSKLAFAIHKFFQENGFLWVAAPIITSNDAEGAGEGFCLSQDKNKPFFDSPASLTVSGQLNAEAYAQAFKKVYTFGPTFRAERSHTNRHMSEFWMVEPEIAFIDLKQLQLIIEAFIKYIVKYVNDECSDEIKFFAETKPFILDRINQILTKDFIRVDYSEGIQILLKAIKDGMKFEDNDIYFGKDLASEHERYLCEKVFKCPIFLQNYPMEIKAFYMKENDDSKTYKGKDMKGVSGKTVAANDLLVPGVGEIVGGSQREDSYDKLMKRVKDLKMDVTSIQWYLDLRKYGYFSSAGFGLGFERMIMYILDIENIRDTIPFPRTGGKLEF